MLYFRYARRSDKKGTGAFAVTDHCDVYSHKNYDIFTPIQKAHDEIRELNEKLGDKCRILSGVEISEGFWFPQELRKIEGLCDYDVIIGSVHCVKGKNDGIAYSHLDFSAFTDDEIYAYLDSYFNDMIIIADEYDMDILAHLSCPIRYITGKYKIPVDLGRFYEKIELILKKIIKRKIALEVNTSGYALLGEPMPGREIIKMYRSLGGEMLTLGSDAHISENASQGFDRAARLAREIGFSELYCFQGRKPYKYEIKI